MGVWAYQQIKKLADEEAANNFPSKLRMRGEQEVSGRDTKVNQVRLRLMGIDPIDCQVYSELRSRLGEDVAENYLVACQTAETKECNMMRAFFAKSYLVGRIGSHLPEILYTRFFWPTTREGNDYWIRIYRKLTDY